MKVIEQIRTRLLRRFLLKEANVRPPAERQSIDLDSARSVGILFDATELIDREMVLDFAENLRKEGKKVKLLAFFQSNMKSQSFIFPHFDPRHLDWAGRPIGKEASAFTREPFDLLLNLTHQPWTPLDFVAVLSRAKFRVGPYTEGVACYDLMLDLPGQQDLKSFLHQVQFYLKKMRPLREVVAAV